MKLNENIAVLSDVPMVNSKASEKYASVRFDYGTSVWEGFVPIEYRHTGVSIDFGDKDALNEHLNRVYEQMRPERFESWKAAQDEFWAAKPNADVTKAFFDKLAEGGWKCSSCDMPKNPNPQRRIQDLKEFGYTIATDLNRLCPKCKRKTSHRCLLPIDRAGSKGNGYETLSAQMRKRIIGVLGSYDVYECSRSPHCLPDHKFSEIRWDDETKAQNLDSMSDNEIREKFQLMSNQRNQQKREVCRTCFQMGKRGVAYGIPYFFEGGAQWDPSVPQKGKDAERGCVGCAWHDLQEWRRRLIEALGESAKR